MTQKELDQAAEIHELRIKNLKLREHLKILVSHPVGMAAAIISRRYTREHVTKELQISTQN